MSYRTEQNQDGTNSIVIDGFKKGIAVSPYEGIGNIRNLNTSYYPGVAYVNYRRQAATISGGVWFAGTHSTNVSGNSGWIFTAPTSAVMTNPLYKAVSPAGLIYILDDTGQVFKQSAVNSQNFVEIGGGAGRLGNGHGGLAYWNNYLVVFGGGLIEFCGDGSGDAGIISTNWNINNSSAQVANHNTAVFTTNFAGNSHNLVFASPNFVGTNLRFNVNDPVTFTTTGTLPAGLSLNTTYYILTSSAASNLITVSTSIGGSAVTLTSDGTGTHTVTDNAVVVPLGNATNAVFGLVGTLPDVTGLTISSYVDQFGNTISSTWNGATGLYNVVMPDGQKIPGSFTNGSASVSLLSPMIYEIVGSNWQIELLDPTVTSYNPYVSKVDGSLYFANGQFLGRIAETSSPNLTFNPGIAITYSVSAGVTALPEQNQDTIVTMTDLKSDLVIAGQKDIYTWDYLSASTSSPSPVGEQIFSIVNLLSNIYIFAGQKGNIYTSNGFSAQLFFKIPDFIAGIIDPVWSWGGNMVHRSKLIFQLLAQTTTGANILAGIFSLNVSPTPNDLTAGALVMEAQNSYSLTPASGALATGVLIDNSPSANGNDSYYSGWSNGSSTGGIDYNDTTLWQNFEPVIETDIIPIGNILNKQTFGNIEFKLDRPLANGDSIRLSWRPSLTDSYTVMGTTTATASTFLQLSDYYPSNISQSQWAQFKVELSCASSSSSFIPLREIELHYN